MKYTICGKGGSGKSTITALMAKELVKRGKKVLVIDCDESNYGLHQQLGMKLPTTFVDYFGGKEKMLGMLAGGPQNMPALFERPWKIADIPDEYVTEKAGIKLMSPGKIEGANEACACPFNAIMTQFVPMLQLDGDEVVLMDMEAGIEHFGRGTDNATDRILMVVDPSYESIKLSSKVAEISEKIGKPVYYVINKATEKSLEKIKTGISKPENICGVFYMDETIMESGLIGEELSADSQSMKEMVDFLLK